MVYNEKIALLYFSRNAPAEGRKKAWFSSNAPSKNKALATSLIKETSSMIRHSGLKIFHYHEQNQRGQTFGERLANAYQDIFNLGFDAVIAVGNDTPQIASLDWTDIITKLETGNCVLGPTFRKGAYLIGLNKNVFDREKLLNLPWRSDKLLGALYGFCSFKNAGLTPYILEKLRDINSQHDLKKLFHIRSLNRHFKRFILFLIRECNNLFQEFQVFFADLIIHSNSPLRAPPIQGRSFCSES